MKRRSGKRGLILLIIGVGVAAVALALGLGQRSSGETFERTRPNPTSPPGPALEGLVWIKRVHRGGSFLCTDQYCTRYLVGSRGKGEISSGSNHLGFRCVQPPRAPAPGEIGKQKKTSGMKPHPVDSADHD